MTDGFRPSSAAQLLLGFEIGAHALHATAARRGDAAATVVARLAGSGLRAGSLICNCE